MYDISAPKLQRNARCCHIGCSAVQTAQDLVLLFARDKTLQNFVFQDFVRPFPCDPNQSHI